MTRPPRLPYATYVLFEEIVPQWVSHIMQIEMITLSTYTGTPLKFAKGSLRR